MPRNKRIVLAGYPHHVTQRGVRRQDIFFTPEDRQVYLKLLKSHSERFGCIVVAYCLMTNHVHHLIIPEREGSLRWTLQLTHKRYAEYINVKNGWSGHAWQERFYSSPVDERYFWVALRYIEQNPVVAQMVARAQDYPWSSAAYHCGLRDDELLLRTDSKWCPKKAEIADWRGWLEDEVPDESLQILKKNTSKDLPSGSEQFLDKVEEQTGLPARPVAVGRPKKRVA